MDTHTRTAQWIDWVERVNAYMTRHSCSHEEAALALGIAPRRASSTKRIRGIVRGTRHTHRSGPVRTHIAPLPYARHLTHLRKRARALNDTRALARYIDSRPCSTHAHADAS